MSLSTTPLPSPIRVSFPSNSLTSRFAASFLVTFHRLIDHFLFSTPPPCFAHTHMHTLATARVYKARHSLFVATTLLVSCPSALRNESTLIAFCNGLQHFGHSSHLLSLELSSPLPVCTFPETHLLQSRKGHPNAYFFSEPSLLLAYFFV